MTDSRVMVNDVDGSWNEWKCGIRGDFVDSTATVLTCGDEMPLGDRLLGEVMMHADAGDPVLEALRR